MPLSAMICNACDNDTFEEEDDGFFYCLQCGVQAENIIQTGVDVDDLIGDAGDTRNATYSQKNRRRVSQPVTPSHTRYTGDTQIYIQFRSKIELASKLQISGIEKRDREVKREPDIFEKEPIEPEDFGAGTLCYEDYYDEARDRYVKAFLMMITYQCDALVEEFKVTPLIIGLVGPICLRFVALSGVYDENWADKAIQDSELQSEDGELKEAKRPRTHKAEPRNLDGKRAVTIWVSLLKKSLPLSNTLAISFLACHKAGAPVLPTDIVRWTREGKLPYLSCFLKIREQMGDISAACPVRTSNMARPLHVISAQMLEARAALIADIIGLPLPPVNFYGIASNYLKRLSIPEDKILDLVRLIQNWSMPPDLYLSKNELRLPTRVCVMSILIVAIRMLYNINGFGVWERSLGFVNASEEDVLSEDVDSPVHEEEVSETKSAASESSDVGKATTEFDSEELLKKLEARYHEVAAETLEFEKDLLSYLSLGKNEIFAGLEEESPDDTYITVNNLWDGYPKDEECDQFRTPPYKRERNCEDDIPLNKLSLEDDPCSSSPSRRNENVSMDLDSSSSEHRVSSSPENHHQKERMINRLITDMGENLFCYIPPRVKIKRLDYLQYVRKKEDGALVYAAHADYYILLRVCAKVAEIDVRNMHRGVLSFERRLAWIEKRIDQVLHITLPFMTCDHCCDGETVGQDQDDLNTNNAFCS